MTAINFESEKYSNIPAIPFCMYTLIEDNWVCSVCGTSIPKSVVPEKPFSSCRIGYQRSGLDKFRESYLIDKSKYDYNKKSVSEIMGPGTELKKLLKMIGITSTPNCSCNQKAVMMNNWGSDACEEKIDIIIGWLKEEAEKRKLPFIETIARMIVKKAIKNARKQEQKLSNK
jgi:hypothetical protein